jgi:hypothetical protein
MDNTNELLYSLGTPVRFRNYPEVTGYIVDKNKYRPIPYSVRLFFDNRLLHALEHLIEPIPAS